LAFLYACALYASFCGLHPVIQLDHLFNTTFFIETNFLAIENDLVELDNILTFHFWRWAVIVLPFYCAAAVIFLPLVSAFTSLAFGYLLGYIYIGYLATALIFVS